MRTSRTNGLCAIPKRLCLVAYALAFLVPGWTCAQSEDTTAFNHSKKSLMNCASAPSSWSESWANWSRLEPPQPLPLCQRQSQPKERHLHQ